MDNNIELWALHWIAGFISGRRRLDSRQIGQIQNTIQHAYQERQRLFKEEKENGETNV